MIYNNISSTEFAHWIANSDNYKNNFSYEGANALQEYLEDLSDEIGENIEFDPIAWCCEYSEYTPQEITLAVHQEHGGDTDMTYPQILEWYQDRTTVIEFDGGIIVQDF